MHVCVIGGGISGLSVASMLHDAGINCHVYEKEAHVGGLLSCSINHGHLFHKVGGHVFNSRNAKVADWFWGKFNKESEFILAKRKAAIWFGDRFVDYPIELHLQQLDHGTARQVVNELLFAGRRYSGQPSFLSLGDYLLHNFGKTLYEVYFGPYNRKIWKRDLSSIPLEWLAGKLPMIHPDEILRMNLIGASDDMVHSSFYYPRQGGSQFIVDRLASALTVFNEPVRLIEWTPGYFVVNNTSRYTHIVYTGDVRRLPSILGSRLLNDPTFIDDHHPLCRLPSSATTTMLCECDANPYSWVYIPSDALAIHRIIMTGNFSPQNSSPCLRPDRTTCTVEYAGYLSQAQMAEEVSRLPFRLRPIAYNFCPVSYIVHNTSTAECLDRLAPLLESLGIFLCGRFAEWKYYNIDAAIESAMQITDKLIRLDSDCSVIA